MDLHDALLHIIIKVPGNHRSNSFLMVLHLYLQPVFINGLNNFNDFNIVPKVGIHVPDLLAVHLTEDKVWQIFFSADLFLVWDQFSELDVLASMDNHEVVLAVNSRGYLCVRFTLKDQKCIDQILILSVIKQLLWKS